MVTGAQEDEWAPAGEVGGHDDSHFGASAWSAPAERSFSLTLLYS